MLPACMKKVLVGTSTASVPPTCRSRLVSAPASCGLCHHQDFYSGDDPPTERFPPGFPEHIAHSSSALPWVLLRVSPLLFLIYSEDSAGR